MRHTFRRAHGFSVLEMVIATAMMMTVTAAVFSMMNPAQGAFQTQPEVSDLQQRLRIAQDTIYKDLIMAGAGMYGMVVNSTSVSTGPLFYYFAPVLPYRQGAVGDAGVGGFRTDTITLFYVPSTTAQTTTSTVLNSSANPATLTVNQETDCPQNVNLCGFTPPMEVLIFDDSGNYDTFQLTAVAGSAGNATGTMTVNRPPDSVGTTYAVGSKVTQVVQRTYYLNTTTHQLVYYDGSTNADVPVVDHVVGLKFDYYGDPEPPTIKNPGSSTPQPTYGPKPTVGVANCVFTNDTPTPLPALPVLGSGTNTNTLVQLTQAQLTDGPWCPSSGNSNRWDADLLRIRKIGVTVRVEAAVDALRGPASVLFTRGGTSTGGNKWVPDQEIRFEVSPRNMNLGR